MISKQRKNNHLMKMASVASVTTAVCLMFAKLITYFMTGSVSILSSLFDSIQDFMTSIVSFVAVSRSIEPADKHHRFGHGKAQAIGGVFQGIIIFMAAAFLLKESVIRFLNPEPIQELRLGVSVTIFVILATMGLVSFQTYVIKETKSLSIKADRMHYAGDVLMNLGVIISMVCSYFFDLYVIDALFGVGVSIYLFVSVFYIIKEAFSMLMDEEMPEEFRNDIKKMVLAFPDVCEITDLKTRSSGTCVFIQFNIKMNSSLSLKTAHEITEYIEDGIKDKYPDSQIIIHLEPSLKVEST